MAAHGVSRQVKFGVDQIDHFRAAFRPSPLHSEAAQSLMAASSTDIIREMRGGVSTAKHLTESDAIRISNSTDELKNVNADQAKQIVEINPTEQALDTLIDRDRAAAVDLAVLRPDIGRILLNSDQISATVQKEVKVRQGIPA
jgi:hypothetical protein